MQNSPNQPTSRSKSAFGLITVTTLAIAAIYLLMSNQSVTASGVVVFDSRQLFWVTFSLMAMATLFTLAGLKVLPRMFSYLLYLLPQLFSRQGIGLMFVFTLVGYLIVVH